jgi:hypothetical protein
MPTRASHDVLLQTLHPHIKVIASFPVCSGICEASGWIIVSARDLTKLCSKAFLEENVFILVHYTNPCTNRTPKKSKITWKFKNLVHLPRSLQRSARRHHRSRFPIVTGHQSQSPQGGGRRGGLTARWKSRVHRLPSESANSGTHDASFVSTVGNSSKAEMIWKKRNVTTSNWMASMPWVHKLCWRKKYSKITSLWPSHDTKPTHTMKLWKKRTVKNKMKEAVSAIRGWKLTN